MSDDAPGNPIEAMLDHLEKSGEGARMEGIDLDRLKAAMSAPGAVETVAEIQAMGAGSRAGVGEPAPEFDLPYLPGHGGSDGDRVRLSDHFGKRPVALIFGSYT